MSPEVVISRSQRRGPEVSRAAAHFELATHLWISGRRALAIGHFKEAHSLQPENWTYKRQAYSAVGSARHGGEFGRFMQSPPSVSSCSFVTRKRAAPADAVV